jgi:hypothetical protein
MVLLQRIKKGRYCEWICTAAEPTGQVLMKQIEGKHAGIDKRYDRGGVNIPWRREGTFAVFVVEEGDGYHGTK